MARSRLDVAASAFKSDAEALHQKFLAISADPACTRCQSAGYGEAILAAWLQTKWSNFTRDLVVASALGTRRTRGTPVRAISGVRTLPVANKTVKDAAARIAKKRGTFHPVWHDPLFAIDVGTLLELDNLQTLEVALGPTLVPRQITAFRNYLVHPGDRTRQKYEDLEAKLGIHSMGPEQLLHQLLSPGLKVFTLWVRELQRIADVSTTVGRTRCPEFIHTRLVSVGISL